MNFNAEYICFKMKECVRFLLLLFCLIVFFCFVFPLGHDVEVTGKNRVEDLTNAFISASESLLGLLMYSFKDLKLNTFILVFMGLIQANVKYGTILFDYNIMFLIK